MLSIMVKHWNGNWWGRIFRNAIFLLKSGCPKRTIWGPSCLAMSPSYSYEHWLSEKKGVSTMSCFKYSTIRIQSKWLHKPEFALFVSLYKSKWNLLHIVGIFNDAFKQLYNSWYIAKTPISLSPVSLTVHEVTFCLNRKANSSWRSSQN